MHNVDVRWQARWATSGYRKGRGGHRIAGIVLHSGDGASIEGDLATLTTSGRVSAHWYVARDGRIWHMVRDADTAWHAGKAIPGWSNRDTIGIEQEHVDGRDDWPDAQVQAVAGLVAALRGIYGRGLPVKGHASVCSPTGRKVDPQWYPWDRLHAAVAEIGAATLELGE